jgi:hypothetical protein
MTGRSALSAIATCCVLAAPASAATITATDVVSPSGLIRCWAVVKSTELECTAPYIHRFGELDPYLAVRARGRAILGQRGDYPGYGHKPRTLRYGDTWKRPGIRCAMRTTGITCRNRDRHGFHIQRGKVYRF